jgi:23S rRNA (guanosine2251-2'-O)-methyltransferase
MFLFGFHAIEEILKKGRVRGVLYLVPGRRRGERLRSLARAAGLQTKEVSAEEYESFARGASREAEPGRHARGAALWLEEEAAAAGWTALDQRLSALAGRPGLVLLLDEITDPRNLGAILRSADQFGVDWVVIPRHRAGRQTEAVVQSSAGASVHMGLIVVPNLVEAIKRSQAAGFWVYGASLEGRRLDEVSFPGSIALVLGSEGRGLRRLVAETCDEQLRIPSWGRVDSFNVSVAAGILLYEVRRQQGFPGFKRPDAP